MHKWRGFTLIEILVVLAIIGMMAALLFPVLGGARERARMATCTSNLHQIHLAREMYKQDYNVAFPAQLHRLLPNYLKDKRPADVSQ